MNLFHDKPFTDEDAVEELEEMLEDHHTESITFLRDDMGIWYARINSDLGYCSASHWRVVNSEAQDMLNAEFELVRDRD